MELFPQHFGFEIRRNFGGCFYLVDRDTFNNWGALGKPFETEEAAVAYAARCDRFKRGLSMAV